MSDDSKPRLIFDYRDSTGQYLPISVESIDTGATDDYDLFTKAGNQFFIVKPKNSKLNPDLIKKLKKNNPYLYIRASDRDHYFKRFETHFEKSFKDNRLTPQQKAAMLTDWTVEIIDQLYQDPSHPETIQQAKNATEYFVRYISERNQAFLELVELRDHDHYTYAHSVGVASYSIALALARGFKDQDLVNVGLAGLLHDVGKAMIDPKIINKQGPLNSDEWSQMKKHPLYGSEILSKHKDLPKIISLAAEGHHENMTGTGYPKGLEVSKLDPLVGIISMADAYSALTTKRSYSTPRDTVTALKLMKESIPKKFSSELFKSFVIMFLSEGNQKKIA